MDGVKQTAKRTNRPNANKATAETDAKKTIETQQGKKTAGGPKGGKTGFIGIIVAGLVIVLAVYGWQNADKSKLKNDLEQSIRNKEKEFNLKLNEYEQDVSALKEEKQSLEDEKSKLEEELDSIMASTTLGFTNAELGVTFKYPISYGEAKFEESKGEKGKRYTITFSKNDKLVIGGISPDYQAGSEGTFSDTRGYAEKGGKYYFKSFSSESEEDYALAPIKTIEANGSKILVVDKGSFASEKDAASSQLSPGEGSLGAILNLNSENYSGMSIWDKDASSTPLARFEEMLKTIQVK